MTEYRCDNPGRREALREQSAPVGSRINAIDYVVVSDAGGVPEGLRQRILRIRFEFADHVSTISTEDVTIRGGVRVVDPRVRWALPMVQVNAPSGPAVDPAFDPELTVAERAWLGTLASSTPDPDNWVLVLTEVYGDFSRYRLAISQAVAPSPPRFDSVLSSVEFSFKVDCTDNVDCPQEPGCPPPSPTAPELDYLARDFVSFRRLMFDRLALSQPEEPSQDAAMLRTAVVEVLAYAADHISYTQDVVATEAYLATARLRSSVRRHARLLDYNMHEGCNARAFVHLEVHAAVVTGKVLKGAQLLSRVPATPTVISPSALPKALAQRPTFFETLHDLERLSDAHNEIHFHTFGDAECCLPKGATEATVLDPGGRLTLAAGDFLVLEEIRGPSTGLAADADPARRHAVRLTQVFASETDALLGQQIVRLAWHEDDALPFPIFVSGETQPLSVARGNIVLCDHGRTFSTTAGGRLPVDGFGRQGNLRAHLPATDLTWCVPYEHTALKSAHAALGQDPSACTPQITLTAEEELWQPVPDLLSSAASAREFVVETESDGSATLRFGNDRMGRRPTAEEFDGVYRVGNGETGNVGAEALAHVIQDPNKLTGTTAAAIVAIRNPLAATGGRPRESLGEVKLYAPRAFRTQQRAVTEADWVEVTGRHPEVQRAVATIRWTGSWNTVFINVDRIGGRPTDDDFQNELLQFLEPFRLAGYDLELGGAVFVPLDIALSICVADGFFKKQVEQRLYEEFSSTSLEDGTPGFFHPDRFTFGESVYLSQIVSRAAKVPGVKWVGTAAGPGSRHRFKRWGQVAKMELEDGVVRIQRLEIARCDNDPNFPDNGQIRFFMEGSV